MDQTSVALRKGSWLTEEDTRLRKCIEKYGEGKWHQVPFRAGLNRCRKSCRLRWLNYLRPDIKRGYFSKDEVDLIIRLHKLLGNRWSLIAGRLPGRTANDVKNFWNAHIYKKLVATVGSSTPTVPRECNDCCRTKTIHNSSDNIIKPRPRNFFKPPAPIQDIAKANKPQTAEESNKKVKKSTTILSTKPWTTGNVENPKNNHQQCSSSPHEKEDECIQWWKNLLEEATDSVDLEIPNLAPNKDKSCLQIEGPILSLPGLGEENGSLGPLGFGTLCQDHTVDDVWDWELL